MMLSQFCADHTIRISWLRLAGEYSQGLVHSHLLLLTPLVAVAVGGLQWGKKNQKKTTDLYNFT